MTMHSRDALAILIAAVVAITSLGAVRGGGRSGGTSGGSSRGLQRTSEYAFTPGAKLYVDLKSGGSATVRGGADARAKVTVESGDEEALRISEEDGGLEIRSDYLDSHGQDLELVIEVPAKCDVEFHSMGGSLTLIGVEGDMEGQTMGGELRIEGSRGNVQLTTMGGNIGVKDSALDGKLSTMGGEVLFENVVGGVEGSSMGGTVRYVNVKDSNGQPRAQGGLGVDGMTGKTVTMSTMGGDIEVDQAPAGAAVSTMGGDIEIDNASRFVKAETMGGDIRITVGNGWINATTMGGSIETTVLEGLGDDGSKGISLTSMAGDIDVTLPAGLSLDLDLTIDYTRNSDQNYKIETPYSLKEERSTEWDSGHGTPRKTIHATGRTGDGKHNVKIKTVNGDIKIREAR